MLRSLDGNDDSFTICLFGGLLLERERETDRQTDRQTETDRDGGRETERKRGRERERYKIFLFLIEIFYFDDTIFLCVKTNQINIFLCWQERWFALF